MALFVGVWDRWDILPREEVDGEVSNFKGMFYTYWVGCLLGKEQIEFYLIDSMVYHKECTMALIDIS